MKTKKASFAALLVALAISAVIVVYGMPGGMPGATPAPDLQSAAQTAAADHQIAFVPMNEVNMPASAPAITFDNKAGEALDLSVFSGRWVLLNLWASWCVPCVAEMPALDRLQRAMANDNLTVVAVSVDGGREKALGFFEKGGFEALDFYHDAQKTSFKANLASGLPTTLLITPDGMIVARLDGPSAWDSSEMQSHLRKMMAAE